MERRSGFLTYFSIEKVRNFTLSLVQTYSNIWVEVSKATGKRFYLNLTFFYTCTNKIHNKGQRRDAMGSWGWGLGREATEVRGHMGRRGVQGPERGKGSW